MLQGNLYLNGMAYCGIRIEDLAPPSRIVSGVLAELIGTVALVAGRRQIAKIYRVEWVQRLGEVMVVGVAFTAMRALDIADAAKRTFSSLIGGYEGFIVIVDVTDLGAQCSKILKRL